MTSTYINNLRLEEIGTGDASGTWGTKTNTNLELIGKALGYATQASFGSDANATTTVADGADDPARALYFKVTSGATLSTTRELTIAPNTMSRVMIIENATTGSQIITIKQGSGATVNIPSGGVKAVYLDGAGSGAAVADAFTDLDLTGTTTAATITASGVITGATVEATGDTAAGDNAAIGYTAAEGLILTGQGSTNDVTIKNDADVDVLEIPTGTTNVDIVGVATATTFEPDGDTAAGDNAAIGYTAAEGLILTGQGSTNDVTVKNDADGDVIAIPTGGTDVNFHGNVNILAQRDLRLQDSSGGEYAAIQAPATIASSYTLTLPTNDGDADQVLTTNGSGVLSFASETTPVSGFVDIGTTNGATYAVTGVGFTPSLIVLQAFGGDVVGTPGGGSGEGGNPFFATSVGRSVGTSSTNSSDNKVLYSYIRNAIDTPSALCRLQVNNYAWWINNFQGNFNGGHVSAIGTDGFTLTASVVLYGTTCSIMWTCYK